MGNRKFNYTIYIVAGAYMIYIAFTTARSLITGENTKNVPFFACASVFFVIVGVIIIIMGIKGLKKIKEKEREEAEKAAEEEAARAKEQPPIVRQEAAAPEGRKLTIAERARLAAREIPVEGVLEEIDDTGDTEEAKPAAGADETEKTETMPAASDEAASEADSADNSTEDNQTK